MQNKSMCTLMKKVIKRMPDGTHYLPLGDEKKTPICPFKDLDPAPITEKAKQQQNYGVIYVYLYTYIYNL